MDYYVLVPISELKNDMIEESVTSRLGKKPTVEEVDDAAQSLRLITDTSATPDKEYAILKVKAKYPNTLTGYKKYNQSEILTELADAKYAHNQ